MKYIINDIPPSNNQFIGRTNYREYQRAKKFWAELIFYSCRPRPKQPIDRAIVELTYHFTDGRRRDPDNYSGKMILDGLVKAGIIADDSFKNIQLVLSAEFKQPEAKTIITIKEI